MGLRSEVAQQAAAALDAAEQHEANRGYEMAAAEAELKSATAAVEKAVGDAVARGEKLRAFGPAEALRRAISRAEAGGVDRDLINGASQQLVPMEAAEHSHHAEVGGLTEQLHSALSADSESLLATALALSTPLRPYLHAELYDAALARSQQFRTAHELASSTADLKRQMEVASGAEGAAPLRTALQRAEGAGLQGLLVRKASMRLKELSDLEDAAERELEAVRYLEEQEGARRAQAAQRRAEEAGKEEDKERRRAEKRAAKEAERQSAQSSEADFLANLAQVRSPQISPNVSAPHPSPYALFLLWPLISPSALLLGDGQLSRAEPRVGGT